MSVSLATVIESAGYDLTTQEDAIWLLRQQNEFDELVRLADELLEEEDDE